MKKQMFINLCGALIGILAIDSSIALTLQISADGNKIGKTEYVYTKRGEKLSSIAKRNGISFAEIIEGNPTLTSKKTLAEGTRVAVPKYFPLPAGPREGIILNLANLRIYYFHPDGVHVSTYPVAAGKQGWSTPQGETTIVAKEKNPAWRPPASIRREAARRGRNLPLVVAPGPRNPLGRYAMRLGFGGILIHGTNQPGSIGTRASHGCIRMLGKDIEDLFKQVPVGTPVRIVHQTKPAVGEKATVTAMGDKSRATTMGDKATATAMGEKATAKGMEDKATATATASNADSFAKSAKGIRIPAPILPIPAETASKDSTIKIPNGIPGASLAPTLGPYVHITGVHITDVHITHIPSYIPGHMSSYIPYIPYNPSHMSSYTPSHISSYIPYRIDLCYKCTYVNAWLRSIDQ